MPIGPHSANARWNSSPTRDGPHTAQLLPRFDTITYREAVGPPVGSRARWQRSAHPVRPGDRVAVLGFASVDYTTIDLALIQLRAVSVPLQTSAPLTQLRRLSPRPSRLLIAVDIDHLADAVELVLTEHSPRRLVVFDYRPQVDDQREAFDAAKARLGRRVQQGDRGNAGRRARPRPTRCPCAARRFRLAGPPDVADLHLRQHRAPKGAMYPAHWWPILAPSFQALGRTAYTPCRRSRSASCR